LQIAEPPLPDLNANQAQCGMTYRRRHSPDLAIAALGQRDFEPARGDILALSDRRSSCPQFRFRDDPCCGWAGDPIPQPDPAAKSVEGSVIGHSFHLRPIGLGELETRCADVMLERAIIRQQQQALRIPIKPAGGVNRRYRDMIGEARVAVDSGELTDYAVRLIETH